MKKTKKIKLEINVSNEFPEINMNELTLQCLS